MGSIALAVACALPASAATEFKDVGMRCAASAKDPRVIPYAAGLILDDAGRAFTIRMERPERRTVTVAYGDILKVVVESASAQAAPGSTEAEKHYWFYFERKPGAFPDRFVLTMGREGADLLAKTRPFLGDRLQELNFPMAQEMTDLSSLTDRSSNYSVHVRRPGPPLPAAIPKDRVLIVVVCPAVDGAKRLPIGLDANGRVVAVNEPGTYSFSYLDPGEYTIASQAENARWLRVKLEAGKSYYFFQDGLDAGERTGLSMHSKEMALFEISGAAYSDWRREKY
jgi:hypothetical protein